MSRAERIRFRLTRNLPTFILIGPGRAGTTWLYEVLRAHPQVFMARGTKETFFFDREFHRGIEWYRKFFEGRNGALAVGEVTNTYIYDPLAPRRIKTYVPDVRLLTCLRDPLERIQSVYFYRKRAGRIACSFEEALDNYPDLLTDNLYWTLLCRYLECFDRAQLSIFFYDDLQADPILFTKTIYQAVGVDDEYVPAVAGRKINPGAAVRFGGSHRFLRWVADSLRSAGLHPLLNTLKRSVPVRSLVYRNLGTREQSILTPALRSRLIEMYQPEVDRLAEFTGRKLDRWLKA